MTAVAVGPAPDLALARQAVDGTLAELRRDLAAARYLHQGAAGAIGVLHGRAVRVSNPGAAIALARTAARHLHDLLWEELLAAELAPTEGRLYTTTLLAIGILEAECRSVDHLDTLDGQVAFVERWIARARGGGR